MTASKSCVAVWRHRWLMPSETFIRDQVSALRSWRALTVGRYQLEPSLLRADVAPFTGSLASRARLRVLGHRAGHRAYRRAFEEADVRLVHAHFATEGNTAVPLARSLGLPLVVTCHGYDVTASLRGAAQARREQALASVFAYSARLVAVSEFIAERLRWLGAPSEKIVVHRIGVRTTGFASTLTANPDRAGILFVGRFVEKKGIEDLLKAYATLPAQLRATSPLMLAGDGDERPRIERLAASLDVHPILLGWQSPSEVRRLMGQAAVFCAPSRTASDGDAEGFGLVFLEAALSGLPSVSYRHGGVPEAVVDGRTGVLVEEGDVEGLTEALRDLLSNRDRAAELGGQGRERVLSDFDIAHTTAGLERIYDDVVGERRVDR